MRVAIVHYWFVGMRGGEKVVEAILDIYPDADIYCHVCDNSQISKKISSRIKGTTFISRMPWATKLYRNYLTLMPIALEQLDLTEYDLVISSESGPAKGIIISPDATHICYCHSPMRYVWDMYHQYRNRASLLKRIVMPAVMHYLRMWDVSSSHRVTHFIANSKYVAQRINKYYCRGATVINPPVNFGDFEVSEEQADYYLIVGQLVDYKKADIAIEAFNQNGRKLVVIGEGELLGYCRRIAKPNITLLGSQPASVLKEHYAKCRALIFPGIEDFGIVPLEAMASGRPVIAYAKGGALDTVIEGKTGLFFNKQSPEAITSAILHFEDTAQTFDSKVILEHARSFDTKQFIARLSEFINSVQE
ncbi:MAG: glycosyltransferase [Halieaceae bacterium]|jgi:glycosyltransferase involved in cell wall biosynthesis|nr:glycosyltransferase [Halieaceae bacterium]